ncbi:hypothetical protein [Plastoroseomonas hellenica]|uniref:hypothetical protein n=1 Tax=Plastoroseomonas hellenica TaxID=2687306 RepID=UPI001BAB203B|nr:hypothetical protein [Plastoroseomonas hellenica]MBR0644477.1 hypothetical protein [Plastoroseomonas hellenica]
MVPFPPGGGIDIVGRLVARHLPGARFVVTNRAGAGYRALVLEEAVAVRALYKRHPWASQ